VVVLAGVAAVGVAAWALTRIEPPPRVDLSLAPDPVFATIPFEVGDTYTLGSAGVPPEIKRPVTVTAVEIVHARGVEILGVGAFEPDPDASGLVPDWPPQGRYEKDVRDVGPASASWTGDVFTLVGVRTTEPKSGLRGIDVRWIDGDGVAGGRIFDLAVVTCAPGACVADAADADLLRQLGLLL
jgi:hypothetical protein